MKFLYFLLVSTFLINNAWSSCKNVEFCDDWGNNCKTRQICDQNNDSVSGLYKGLDRFDNSMKQVNQQRNQRQKRFEQEQNFKKLAKRKKYRNQYIFYQQQIKGKNNDHPKKSHSCDKKYNR